MSLSKADRLFGRAAAVLDVFTFHELGHVLLYDDLVTRGKERKASAQGRGLAGARARLTSRAVTADEARLRPGRS